MRSTIIRRMGAGGQFKYPKYVASPAGGWQWPDPPNWERNTAFGLLGIVGITAMVWSYGSTLEKHYSQKEKL